MSCLCLEKKHCPGPWSFFFSFSLSPFLDKVLLCYSVWLSTRVSPYIFCSTSYQTVISIYIFVLDFYMRFTYLTIFIILVDRSQDKGPDVSLEPDGSSCVYYCSDRWFLRKAKKKPYCVQGWLLSEVNFASLSTLWSGLIFHTFGVMISFLGLCGPEEPWRAAPSLALDPSWTADLLVIESITLSPLKEDFKPSGLPLRWNKISKQLAGTFCHCLTDEPSSWVFWWVQTLSLRSL